MIVPNQKFIDSPVTNWTYGDPRVRFRVPVGVAYGSDVELVRRKLIEAAEEEGILEESDRQLIQSVVEFGDKTVREVMTARMIRAVSNPLVNTLNHPHGRLLRRRTGYAVDMAAVVEAAARAGCALELNSQPDRLDLNAGWARRARAAGARFTVSSDAHSTRSLDNLTYGVGSARRGWLTAADVLNTRPLEELRAILAARRPR